jgi:hypothetical protein
MKRVILLSICLLAASILTTKGQSTIHSVRFGSTGGPLKGLSVAWNSSGTADSIAWGYTPDLERGDYPGKMSTSITGNRFEYTFPLLTASSTLFYGILDSQDNFTKTEKLIIE